MRYRTPPKPFLGNAGKPKSAALRYSKVADGFPVEPDHRPAAGEFTTQQRQQFALAISRYARDADDFSAVYLERYAAQRDAKRIIRLRRQAGDFESRLELGGTRIAMHRGQHRSDHHACKFSRVHLLGDCRSNRPTSTQDGGAIAQLANLIQLVADIEDAAAARRQRPQHFEQAANRLRRQDRGRFIQNQ